MAPIPVKWEVSHENMLLAIFWACKKLRYSIDRPGMNRRTPSEALDDKIMGDIATMAVLEYLDSINVGNIAYDEIRQDNFQRPNPGWDIVIGNNANHWGENTHDFRVPRELTTISIKSSRLPRNDTLTSAINTRDFKIFKHSQSISNDITTDLEVQVYYPFLKTQLNGLETNATLIDNIRQAAGYDRDSCQRIFDDLNVGERWNESDIVGYNDKESMHTYSQTLRGKTWDSFGKTMWVAPLRLGKSMPTIIGYN